MVHCCCNMLLRSTFCGNDARREADSEPRHMLGTFYDIHAEGCKDWRWQSLNRPSRNAVYRGREESIALKRAPRIGQ